MTSMSVSSWPTYLWRDVPESTRATLEADADLNGSALVETVREILCAHYGLDCEAVETSGPLPGYTPGTRTMLLRLQPELYHALMDDPRSGGRSHIINDILKAHYNGSR